MPESHIPLHLLLALNACSREPVRTSQDIILCRLASKLNMGFETNKHINYISIISLFLKILL